MSSISPLQRSNEHHAVRRLIRGYPGAGAFFISYFLLETPFNLALLKMGARRWIARIMFTWGHLSGAIAFVWNGPSFHIIRFLFGAAEAGFFCGHSVIL